MKSWVLIIVVALLAGCEKEEPYACPVPVDNEAVATDDMALGELAIDPTYTIETQANFYIECSGGKGVEIDCSGDEVKVIGASEEGAKIFFEQMLKPIIDDYLRTKKQ